MIRHISLALIVALVSGALSAAVDTSTRADTARIEVRGTIEREGNRPVVRAGGSAYQLDFPNSSLREFASNMAGERVVVRGELRTRRMNGRARLAIRPDYIGREGGSEEVSIQNEAMNVSVDDQFGIAAPPRPAVTIDENVEVADDVEYSEEIAPPSNRWEARKRDVLNRNNRRHYGSRVIMTPGGGTIILNNQ